MQHDIILVSTLLSQKHLCKSRYYFKVVMWDALLLVVLLYTFKLCSEFANKQEKLNLLLETPFASDTQK